MESQAIMSDHSQDIMLKLNNDRKTSAKYCDITLIVDEHKYPAHKCVLGLLSPFYDKMFSIEMKERFDNEAVIKGVSKEVFEAILEFVYTSSITLNMENVFGMIEAAHYMDLPYVKECCTTYLGDAVNAENWLSVLAFAKRYDYEELVKKVNESLSAKFDAIVNAKNFVELDIDELQHLLSLKKETVASEEKLYEAVIGWIKTDITGRKQYAENLLKVVNFSKMSLNFLNQVVAKETLLENSFVTLKAVFRAIGNQKKSPESQLSVVEQPTTSKTIGHVLPLKDFVAVDNRTVRKFTSHTLAKKLLKHNHAGGSAVLLGSTVVVISGFETKQTEGVDVKTLQFDSLFDVSTKYHHYAGAAVVNNDILYVTGGLGSEKRSESLSVANQDLLLPDPTHNWSLIFRMNFDRHGHALASFCNHIYVMGGNCYENECLLKFDPFFRRSTTLTPMINARSYLSAVVFNQEIYAIGGISKQVKCAIVEKYNPLTLVWKSVARLNVARNQPGACVLNNQIVVVGGGSSVVEVYDEKKNVWNVIGDCEELKDVFALFPC